MAADEDRSAGRMSVYTNTDRVLHKGPLKLCCVMLAGDGANADCQVYDGESANDELKAHIEALSGTTSPWGPGLNLEFKNGLYIAVSATSAKVTATFTPLSRKAKD